MTVYIADLVLYCSPVKPQNLNKPAAFLFAQSGKVVTAYVLHSFTDSSRAAEMGTEQEYVLILEKQENIMRETGGRGTDSMQASEYPYNACPSCAEILFRRTSLIMKSEEIEEHRIYTID